jgi:hypothetical protein
MLEDKVRLFSENLARALDRRKFIRTTGTAMFGTLAALATGRMALARSVASGGTSSGARSETPPPWPPSCAPPGPYCNLNGTSDGTGCLGSRGPYDPGASCFQHRVGGNILQCRVIYNWYQAGCWTTNVTGGRWTCCDCGCGTPQQAMCGCAQFSTSAPPRPDGPGSGKN